MDYTADFEQSQHFSGTFNAFARKFAAEIAERFDISGKRVLEIGCGKGEFLIELCKGHDAIGLGIDPGYRADDGRGKTVEGLEFIVDNFGPKYENLEADLILCRHTLEHIFPVSTFLRSVSEIAKKCKDLSVVFETPDGMRVLEEGAFWDIYYEHCCYFSPGALARAFRNADLDVTHLELAYGDQYIIQYARALGDRTTPPLPIENDLHKMRKLAADFGERVAAVRQVWNSLIRSASAAGKRIVLWGGSSKAVAFLTTLNLQDEVIAVVDVNPYKQGKFLPGTGHRVVEPQALSNIRPDLVVVMNPIYVEEIAATLEAMSLTPEIVALT
ncbi:class I SAM-dependent methyltransferase [Hyphomicrobium sp. 99]|uniref:class I SAM-dependent methyltransferase n=1 Tax=Hyphomicrobium sp. 99 TaxID=1163419 RepID=UPI0005F80FF4|nr:class I SAM-dependent methyltransferase [Hyphomicrobium sp. 99]